MRSLSLKFEAYADPGQDLAALYNRIHAKYLGVDLHDAPLWAYNPMYGSDPIYLQSFVLAHMVARQIQLTVDEIMQAGTGKKLDP